MTGAILWDSLNTSTIIRSAVMSICGHPVSCSLTYRKFLTHGARAVINCLHTFLLGGCVRIVKFQTRWVYYLRAHLHLGLGSFFVPPPAYVLGLLPILHAFEASGTSSLCYLHGITIITDPLSEPPLLC